MSEPTASERWPLIVVTPALRAAYDAEISWPPVVVTPALREAFGIECRVEALLEVWDQEQYDPWYYEQARAQVERERAADGRVSRATHAAMVQHQPHGEGKDGPR